MTTECALNYNIMKVLHLKRKKSCLLSPVRPNMSFKTSFSYIKTTCMKHNFASVFVKLSVWQVTEHHHAVYRVIRSTSKWQKERNKIGQF